MSDLARRSFLAGILAALAGPRLPLLPAPRPEGRPPSRVVYDAASVVVSFGEIRYTARLQGNADRVMIRGTVTV